MNISCNDIYICKPNQNRVCCLNGIDTTSVEIVENLKECNTLSFEVAKYITDADGNHMVSNGYYNIDYLMDIDVDGVGKFTITEPPRIEDDGDIEKKYVTCSSTEWRLQGINLEDFKINTGDDASYERTISNNIDALGRTINLIKVYDSANANYSLMNIICSNYATDWTVGTVDNNIAIKTPYFNIDSTNVYGFLTQDMAKYLQCFVKFDTLNKTINLVNADSSALDTSIYVGFDNLATKVTIEPQSNNIYTRYNVCGGDKMDISQVNYGDNHIENIDYYLTTKYLPSTTIAKYSNYKTQRDSYRTDYINAVKGYISAMESRDEIINRVPNDALNTDYGTFSSDELNKELEYFQGLVTCIKNDFTIDGVFHLNELQASVYWWDYKSYTEWIIPNIQTAIANLSKTEDKKTDLDKSWETEWDLYGTDELSSLMKSYTEKIQTLSKYAITWSSLTDAQKSAFSSEDSYTINHNLYVEAQTNYNGALAKYNTLMTSVTSYNNSMSSYQTTMNTITETVSIANSIYGFTADELKMIRALYINTNYTNENFTTTTYATNSEKIDESLNLLNYAIEDLAKNCRPQYRFTTEMDNLYALPEFSGWRDKAKVGNYIRIEHGNGIVDKVRILSKTYNPCNIQSGNFTLTFTSMVTWWGNRGDFEDLFDIANSTNSNSVSHGNSVSSSKDSTELGNDLIKYIINSRAMNNKLNVFSAQSLTANEANIKSATVGYLKANMANLDTANINKANVGTLLADVGLITSAVITDGHVTGTLDSVDINANKIKTGTLSVDRLVMNGTTDSIIYALNNSGQLTSTHCDTLDGGLITERTITASHIVAGSITANEIDVTNLFAQDITATGTIQGANIVGGYFETYNENIVGNIPFNSSLTLQLGAMLTWIDGDLCGAFSNIKSSIENKPVAGTFIGSASKRVTVLGKFILNEQKVPTEAIAAYVIDLDNVLGYQEKNVMYAGLKMVNGWISAPAFYENDVALSAKYSGISHVHDDKYLQLTGGTLTGEIKRNGNAIVNTGTNGSTNFCGGTNLSNGANLILKGSTQTGYEGQFCLDARSGSDITSLIGHPNGTLTWGSTTILRSDNFNDYAVKRVQNGSFYALDEESTWIQTPTSGIIPRANNTCNIGADGWQFENIRSQNFYEDTVKLSDKYLQLSGGTLSGNLKVANSSSSGSVSMWNDDTGGNIEIRGPRNTYGYQFDAYNNNQFRCYMFKISPWEFISQWVLDADGFHTNKNLYAEQDLSISRDAYITGNTSIGGTLNGYNIGGSVTSHNNGLVTGGTVYNKLGAIQIIGIIDTPMLKSKSPVANGGTANVTVAYSEYGTDSSIGVMIIPILTQYCNVTTKASNETARTTTFVLTNTSGASHTIGASFVKIYYKNKTQM